MSITLHGVSIGRALMPLIFMASAASAQTFPQSSADARRAELLRERAAIDAELATLDAVRDAATPPSASP